MVLERQNGSGRLARSGLELTYVGFQVIPDAHSCTTTAQSCDGHACRFWNTPYRPSARRPCTFLCAKGGRSVDQQPVLLVVPLEHTVLFHVAPVVIQYAGGFTLVSLKYEPARSASVKLAPVKLPPPRLAYTRSA